MPEDIALLASPRSAEDIARNIFALQQMEMTSTEAENLVADLLHCPVVSIIMPVYDTPIEWLHRAVESIENQYYKNWELCIVDDCSPTRKQSQFLEDLAKSDPRIRFAVMPVNSGICAASNRAVEMASGEFLALVDHDDEITPDALLGLKFQVQRLI